MDEFYSVIWRNGSNGHPTLKHHTDVIMGSLASQITSLTIVCSMVYSGANQSKHQSSASLAFVWGIHRGPVNSPHKGPVTRKMFPFDDVIMNNHASKTSNFPWRGYLWSKIDGHLAIPVARNGKRTMQLIPHWGRDKTDTIFQPIFSYALFWMKIYQFQFRVQVCF